jgi:hypothetical protein
MVPTAQKIFPQNNLREINKLHFSLGKACVSYSTKYIADSTKKM